MRRTAFALLLAFVYLLASSTAAAQGWVPRGNGGGGGTTVTWANDLAGSTATHQYVQSISGNAGGGGTVNLGATVALTALAGAGSEDLSLWTGVFRLPTGNVSWAGASTKTLSFVGASTFTLTGGATSTWSLSSGTLTVDAPTLDLGASLATVIAVGNTSVTALSNTVKSTGTITDLVGATTVQSQALASGDFWAGGGANPAATGLFRAANNVAIVRARNAAATADISVLSTDSSNNVRIDGTNGASTLIDSPGAVELAWSTGTSALIGNNSTTTLTELLTTGAGLIEHNVGGTNVLKQGLASSDLAYFGASGSEHQIIPTGDTFQASVATPTWQQSALASTSGGSGAAGQVATIAAQAGQAATGASHNGGNGGNLLLESGAGGTSGSATAGVQGSVVAAIGTTSGVFAPTGTNGAFQIVDPTGLEAVMGNYAIVSGGSASFSGLWFGPSISPSLTNYTLAVSSSTTYVNAPTTLLNLAIGGTIYAAMNTAALISNTDVQLTLGTIANRWKILNTGNSGVAIYNANTDTKPATQLSNGTLSMGPGGSSNPDGELTRIGAHNWQFDDFASGPFTLNLGGSSSTGSTLIVPGAAASGNGANVSLIAQNAPSGGTGNGGIAYLMSGGANGGTGNPGIVVASMGGSTSHIWTPTGSSANFQVVDSNGLQMMVGMANSASGGNASFTELWLGNGTGGLTPTTSNYTLASSVGFGEVILNAQSTAVEFAVANTNYVAMTTGGFYTLSSNPLTLGIAGQTWVSEYVADRQTLAVSGTASGAQDTLTRRTYLAGGGSGTIIATSSTGPNIPTSGTGMGIHVLWYVRDPTAAADVAAGIQDGVCYNSAGTVTCTTAQTLVHGTAWCTGATLPTVTIGTSGTHVTATGTCGGAAAGTVWSADFVTNLE